MPQVKRQRNALRYHFADKEFRRRLIREQNAYLKAFAPGRYDQVVAEQIRRMEKQVDRFYNRDNKYNGDGSLKVSDVHESE